MLEVGFKHANGNLHAKHNHGESPVTIPCIKSSDHVMHRRLPEHAHAIECLDQRAEDSFNMDHRSGIVSAHVPKSARSENDVPFNTLFNLVQAQYKSYGNTSHGQAMLLKMIVECYSSVVMYSMDVLIDHCTCVNVQQPSTS